MPNEPWVNDVDRRVQVVATAVPAVWLRIWQTLVAPTLWAGSNRLKLAKMPGSCETVTVWPPIVTVPLRDAPPLAVAVITAVPLPAVSAAAVRNDALLLVSHEQFDAPVTLTLTVPPPLFAFTLVLDSVTAQPVPATST